MHILIILLVVLGIVEFVVIYKITKSITYLSTRIKLISSKNLEEKITDIKGEDEIGELATSFNNLLDRLNEAFKREQQFIADVAHEFKTPLATLRGSFDAALTKPRTVEEYKRVFEDRIKQADQLTATLNNILDLAWSEGPDEQKNITQFSLTELTDEIYDIAQKLAASKKITVHLRNEKNIIIAGYKDKLARAILNIIENAVKYTPIKGKINIIIEKTPTKAIINVTDTGIGISQQDLPNIFNRFYRGSKTDKVFGSGLGLAITKSIIHLHQGEIKVKSAPGKGSAFVIALPLVKI
ncbi:MAG: HAMP domain-containing histidine kinase [Actinobacteria bacterium]|nr:HAMP domain-containing histidine kinase [Actinomycetota bacterium]